MGRSPIENIFEMSKYDDLPVYKASYDLLLEIFRFTKEFNKEFKYTVGESLKKETLELITLIYRANSRVPNSKGHVDKPDISDGCPTACCGRS